MKVRLSSALRRQVEDAARANNRTLNSEIVFRLEQSFALAGQTASAVGQFARLEEIERRLSVVENALVPNFTIEPQIRELTGRMRDLERQIAGPEKSNEG